MGMSKWFNKGYESVGAYSNELDRRRKEAKKGVR